MSFSVLFALFALNVAAAISFVISRGSVMIASAGGCGCFADASPLIASPDTGCLSSLPGGDTYSLSDNVSSADNSSPSAFVF